MECHSAAFTRAEGPTLRAGVRLGVWVGGARLTFARAKVGVSDGCPTHGPSWTALPQGPVAPLGLIGRLRLLVGDHF